MRGLAFSVAFPAVFLAVGLLAGSNAAAAADPCDQLPPPSVTVRRMDERFTVSQEHGYKALTHLGAALARPGRQVLGLTQGTALAQFAVRVPMIVDRSGRWECASPQLTLTIGFRPLTVYVANEFAEGGCAYREIYRHELRHVQTYQAHLAAIEAGIAATLSQRFATGDPWRGPVGQTRDRLQRELNERWLPYVQREIQRGDALQAEIDTAEEYDRLAGVCNGTIRNRVR